MKPPIKQPDPTPVRVIRVLRPLRPLSWNKLRVRARVLCRDGEVRDLDVTINTHTLDLG